MSSPIESSPYRQAWALFAANSEHPEWWPGIVEWHMITGYVFAGPDYFLMGRPVDRHAPASTLRDPSRSFDEANAWLVYMAIGAKKLATLAALTPYPLPWIGYERYGRDGFTWLPYEQLIRKVHGKHTENTDSATAAAASGAIHAS